MSALLRDAPFGQVVRYITRNKVLRYEEERQDFQCPSSYSEAEKKTHGTELESPPVAHLASQSDRDLTRVHTNGSYNSAGAGARLDLQRSVSSKDLENALSQSIAAKRVESRPVVPEKLDDGTILVDWYTTDDPENPKNWSLRKKIFVSVQIYLYTLAVYMGSSIYTPSESGVMERFGVGPIAASLGLALYVLAYGLGPLVFSPLSEIPSVGRNPPYMISFAIFVVLCVPTALCDNFAGFLVLRFLQGFFGSPCLATGGASLQDMYSFIKLPYAILFWAFAATCGPALGPIISGFSVAAETWRWSLWEMLWLSGPVFLLMFFALPETYPSNILLRRAQRLRKINGNPQVQSQSEIDQAQMTVSAVAWEALVRPVQLMALDPVIAYTDLYIALCYGIFYSFFEAFPLVFLDVYGFNLGEMGLAFLSLTIGVISSGAAYAYYVYKVTEPRMIKYGLEAPERRLIPALYSSPLLPIGLFIFAWTGRADIHWVVPMIGVALFCIGLFPLFQCIFIYLPFVYPQYAASLFAGNDFARSSFAFASILYARPLFQNLGVPKGVSLLAALTAFMVTGVYILFFYGAWLRQRSRFSAK